MSTEKEAVERFSSEVTSEATSDEASSHLPETKTVAKSPASTQEGESSEGERPQASGPQIPEEDKKAAGKEDETVATVATDSLDVETPRQVIAVSASKGPAAFFNLARKFLVTDEMCDLSALEGAIVSAVDAAHLLERSQLATIVRYVSNASL